MKSKETQKQFVIKELKEHGFISRNHCIENFITRLASIMTELKNDGWVFTTDWVANTKPDGSKGKDFIYRTYSKPKEWITEIYTNVDGERRARKVLVQLKEETPPIDDFKDVIDNF